MGCWSVESTDTPLYLNLKVVCWDAESSAQSTE